jgi:hypothetical protein
LGEKVRRGEEGKEGKKRKKKKEIIDSFQEITNKNTK